MNTLVPISSLGESHMKLASPSTSPRLIQNPSDIIKSEPITHLHLAKWKAEDDLMVKANRQTRDCSSSGPYYCQQQASDLDARKCEPMSPPDNYSITSSPQTFGWPPSSDSGESEPWTLHHHELLPDHSGYAKSPSSPASGWDCAVPYQFQSAPTSAGYFGDCGIPFTAATPPPMQASYSHSPVFEMASSYGSPHYPPSHFADGSPSQQQQQQQQQRPMTCGDLGSLVHETTSHHEYSSAVMATPPSEYQDGSKGKNDINSLPYSQLLYRAFMSSNTRKLSLRQIYQWFEDNTNKAVNNKGWQNSIRHNLSMNRAFEKAPLKEDGTESRRATEWVLADWALQEGVQSTTRYRKGNIRSKSHGSERDRLANSAYSGGRRGVMGYSGRGRERHYSHRMAMHGLAPESHLVYGAAGPPPPLPGAPPPGHLGTCSTGFPEVEGYMTAAAGGLCYSGMEVQEGYGGGGGGFAQQDESTSYNGYAMYSMGEGTAMGEYAIVGGVPDGTLAGTHVGGVVPPTSVGVQFGPQLSSTSSGLVMANEQHHYTHAEYDTRQGISLAPRGTHE